MRCLSVINQKGGCGKTTVSMNLAACLASLGHRTLLIDMDPQTHCAVGLAVPEDQVEQNIYDVLISVNSDKPVTLKNINWQIAHNFDLAPAGIELAALEPQLNQTEGREDLLKSVLARDAYEYDYIVIDCPPGVGILTFNALRASDEVVIPVETGYFAMHGLQKQLETLEVLRKQCHQDITVKVLASMYDVRTKLAREILNELRRNYSDIMFNTIINFNTKLKEAASFGQPITEYDPNSKGMKDFVSLANEIVQNANLAKDNFKPAVETVEKALRKISKSADELLAESELLIGASPAISKNNHEPVLTKDVQQKIADFYGIKQEGSNVTFVAMYPHAKNVQIAGEFNGWKPEDTPLEKSPDGRWFTRLQLDSGRYQYRYVVDGRWQQDPYNASAIANEFGEMNSVLEMV
ncbi:MAG: AAA family ATPase [Sedimentisphaerales bacterium]|nr:AAA family ATPase [Sedimentisphaerales bacterium]MBN2841679.1 AAA family ATPase [Sedimentisphaerales bacterium]